MIKGGTLSMTRINPPGSEPTFDAIIEEQRRLQLKVDEQNRILRQRQDKLMATVEQLQQREADATQLAFVAEKERVKLAAALADLHEAQNKLLRAEKLAAIGQLAATISHEIRNPLGAIRNSWFYIHKKIEEAGWKKSDDRMTRLANMIDQEIDRCARIVGDLLDVSRDRPLYRAAQNLRTAVEGALSMIVSPSASIRVENRVDRSLPDAYVDADQFRQVLINICQNAVEAVDPVSGIVTIDASEQDGWFTLTVSDNGMGISPEVKEKMFEPLMTTKTRGTGLGLTIVDSIVRRHGGTISVDSEPGRGTRIVVRLPQGEPSYEAPTSQGGAADLRFR